MIYNFFPDYLPKFIYNKPLNPIAFAGLKKFHPNLSLLRNLEEFIISPINKTGKVYYPLEKDKPLDNRYNPKNNKDFMDKLATIKDKKIINQKDEETLILFKECDPEIVFLGTGSMWPSPYRNVTGNYIRFWQKNDFGILLDCGESSYMQMLHHYGPKLIKNILINIRLVFLSHIHGDHHLGFFQVMLEREKIFKELKQEITPVYVIIPSLMTSWIHKMADYFNIYSFKIVYCQHLEEKFEDIEHSKKYLEDLGYLNHSEHQFEKEKANDLLLENEEEKNHDSLNVIFSDNDESFLNYIIDNAAISLKNSQELRQYLADKQDLIDIQTIEVDHCPQAYGIAFQYKSGWKLAYSGDTQPTLNFIEKAKGATILIHEATFTDDLQNEADDRAHSTINDACRIGKKIGAWRTILTHFSQRFSHSDLTKDLTIKPNTDENEEISKELTIYKDENVIHALDHLHSKFSQLQQLPLISLCMNIALVDDI